MIASAWYVVLFFSVRVEERKSLHYGVGQAQDFSQLPSCSNLWEIICLCVACRIPNPDREKYSDIASTANTMYWPPVLHSMWCCCISVVIIFKVYLTFRHTQLCMCVFQDLQQEQVPVAEARVGAFTLAKRTFCKSEYAFRSVRIGPWHFVSKLSMISYGFESVFPTIGYHGYPINQCE